MHSSTASALQKYAQWHAVTAVRLCCRSAHQQPLSKRDVLVDVNRGQIPARVQALPGSAETVLPELPGDAGEPDVSSKNGLGCV